ncbi:glycoside hydrolase family 43 protein [Flavobacterium nackdongense]|uniref:Beta-glucanase n=1 Tax=Flavobacterium nackdongense TaxID=2547394 RepID=A0A4P6YHJ4_9FLAO|nr:glycoside hydrolase family 43 protein [Flavobacterium nackdongense]QBN20315.1 beta-glucanase [Flavobacterium nackdongense]
MKSKDILLIVLLFSSYFAIAQTAYTNFKPGEVWLDDKGNAVNAHGGGFLVYDETYYWFGEHKESGKMGAKALVGVHVYSSKDLYNWKDEGVALSMSNDTTSMLRKGCVLERPKVIYNKKTQKFVMWFHHELKDQGYKAALTGVAVSDKVTGPFRYINSMRLHPKVYAKNFTKEQQQIASLPLKEPVKPNHKGFAGVHMIRDFETGQMSRDMNLFVDEDEQAYHITASEENQTLLISKLSDDYLSMTDDYVRVFPGETNEAPAILKKDGKYFMFSSYTTGWNPNPGRLAVSDNMMSGWKALENPCRGSEEEKKTTFHSQSTFVIPVIGKKNTFIYVGDRWNSKDLGDSRYIWLPVEFEDGIPFLKWHQSWDLDFFNK